MGEAQAVEELQRSRADVRTGTERVVREERDPKQQGERAQEGEGT